MPFWNPTARAEISIIWRSVTVFCNYTVGVLSSEWKFTGTLFSCSSVWPWRKANKVSSSRHVHQMLTNSWLSAGPWQMRSVWHCPLSCHLTKLNSVHGRPFNKSSHSRLDEISFHQKSTLTELFLCDQMDWRRTFSFLFFCFNFDFCI